MKTINKLSMVSFKEQLRRQFTRSRKKQAGREKRAMLKEGLTSKQQAMPVIQPGNPDRGCPFRGKDLYSGQWRKAADRMFIMENGNMFCMVYDNNKYSHGAL